MSAVLVLALGIVSLAGPLAVVVPPPCPDPTGLRRLARPGALRIGLTALAVLAVVVMGVGALSLAPWQVLLVLLAPVGWSLWETVGAGPRHELGRWLTAVAGLGMCAALSESSPGRAATAGAATGVLLLLTAPANTAVTSLLVVAGARGPREAAKGDGAPRPQALQGGRWIGPLERVLLLLLASWGAHTAVAALVAAKGVIRFPEISKDDSGTMAEEFLVGSLASWTLAVLGALLLAA